VRRRERPGETVGAAGEAGARIASSTSAKPVPGEESGVAISGHRGRWPRDNSLL